MSRINKWIHEWMDGTIKQLNKNVFILSLEIVVNINCSKQFLAQITFKRFLQLTLLPKAC